MRSEKQETWNVCAVVVVYNVRCADSATCRALSRVDDPCFSVLIYDNSTADFGNRKFCREKGWTYLGGFGNVGLSKAYNESIDYLKQTKVTLVCLFDDDSHIDRTYFDLLRRTRTESEARIFVPFIYANGRLLSPCKIKSSHRTVMFTSEEAAANCCSNEITAINSCMALDMSLFQDYRYDENIFLDGIDHNFLMDMKEKGEKITVFTYRCNHEFSGDTKPSKQSALTRYRIYAKDYRYILRGKRWAYILLVGKRAAKLTLQYRTLSFAKVFIQNLLSKL